MKPIWIVDDDPSIRFVLEKALGREGWPIRSFTQARDALAALAQADLADPERQPPQVHQVPVGGVAVDCAVLAHRRDDDAVGQGQRAQGQRREQLRHRRFTPPR